MKHTESGCEPTPWAGTGGLTEPADLGGGGNGHHAPAEGARVLPKVRLVTGEEKPPVRPVFALPVDVKPPTLLERAGAVLYRLFEIAFALTALLLLSPLLLVTALIIRINSPGPVLFLHARAGRSRPTPGRELIGRTDLRPPEGGFEPDKMYLVPTEFRLVKFRTMYQDAGTRYPTLDWWKHDVDPADCQNKHYKLENDPRVTSVGKWLRRTTVDELPNFWNVVLGHIRLVGPRPEMVEVLRCYTAEQMLKFSVKPGLTCLAEVYGRNDLSLQEHVKWDLEYVRTRSFRLDMKVLCLTVWAVLARKGAT